MENNTIKVNVIPSPTWNWLHMNDNTVSSLPKGKDTPVDQDIKGEVESLEKNHFSITGIKTGMGESFTEFIDSADICVRSFKMPAGANRKGFVKLDYNFDGQSINGVEVKVEEKSELTVIMNYAGDAEEKSPVCVQTRYHVAPEGKLTLVQVQKLGQNIDFMNDIGGIVEDNAEFRLVQVVLGGKNNYYGCFSELKGVKSKLVSDMGYLLKDDMQLDINTVANHNGKKSRSEINVSGVMRDKSRKTFRGTIDFHRGCGGAKGDEIENVLLMDDDVLNRTIPVILCDEEDVEGNHGASIGKIDEDLLFYMESRGLDEKSIYEMMAKGRIESVIRLIPDEETREALL